MLRSLCILGAGALCLMVRNDRLPDCKHQGAPGIAKTLV